LTRKSESKGSQKQSKGDGLLTVSKSDQLKITLPNLKNENKSANRGDYRNTIVSNSPVSIALCFKLPLIYHIEIQDQDQPDYTIQYCRN
jgi:hypothetical protein